MNFKLKYIYEWIERRKLGQYVFGLLARFGSLFLPSKNLSQLIGKISMNANGARALYVVIVLLAIRFKSKRTFGCRIYQYVAATDSAAEVISLCEIYLVKRYKLQVAKLKETLEKPYSEICEVPAVHKKHLESLVLNKLKKPKTKVKFFDPAIAQTVLQETIQHGLKCSLKLFLVSGTLLGFHREGGFVSGEYDIDLGFTGSHDDYDKLKNYFEKHSDFSVIKSLADKTILVLKYRGITIDIFRHYERSGLLWHGSSIHEWWNTPFEVIEKAFNDYVIFTPDNIELYLNENYGNWQKPGLYWDFSLDTPNRVYRKNNHALHYLLERIESGLRAKKSGARYQTTELIYELKENFGYDLTAYLPQKKKR